MDNLVNMKLDNKEKKETAIGVEQPAKGPNYPWGLAITLEDESLKKMKVKLADYQVGDEVILHAECKVTRLSQSEREGDGKNRTMELQITSMGLEASEDEPEVEEDELTWDDEKADRKLKEKGY